MALSKSCPYCGHKQILEVLCYGTDDLGRVPTPSENALKGGIPVFVRSICNDCQRSTEGDKPLICEETGHGHHMEFQYFVEGIEHSGGSDSHDIDHSLKETYRKCKRCLRTWNQHNRKEDFQYCPKCGMMSGVKIEYGEPGYWLFLAERRKEVMIGGCIIGPWSPNWHCNECGYEWGKSRLGSN